MKAQYLGHVVFYVRELERSLAFYRDLLGMIVSDEIIIKIDMECVKSKTASQ